MDDFDEPIDLDSSAPYRRSWRATKAETLDVNQATHMREYSGYSTWIFYDRSEMFLPTRLTQLPGRGIAGGSARAPNRPMSGQVYIRRRKKVKEPRVDVSSRPLTILDPHYMRPKLFRLDGKTWTSVWFYIGWKREELAAIGMDWEQNETAIMARAYNALCHQAKDAKQAMIDLFTKGDGANTAPDYLKHTWRAMSPRWIRDEKKEAKNALRIEH